jgi:hypothetical protein
MAEPDVYEFYCPTYGKEGTLPVAFPEGDLCPLCGRSKNGGGKRCNFTLFKSCGLLNKVLNSPLSGLWKGVEPKII